MRGRWRVEENGYKNSFYIVWRRGNLCRTWEVTKEYLDHMWIRPIWHSNMVVALEVLSGRQKAEPLWRKLLTVARECRKELAHELKLLPDTGKGGER